MNFGELQDAVLERFSESERPKAKQWINLFGPMLYYAEDWEWRFAQTGLDIFTDSFAAGGEPDNIGRIIDVWNAQGEPLTAMPPRDFFRAYGGFAVAGVSGKPESYTAFNSNVYIGPASSETAQYFCVYWLRWVDLLDDDEEPDLPSSFHWLLAAGALAIGQAAVQDPTAAMQDPVVARGLETMRREYLSDVPHANESWPRAAWL